jgi:osomolarity two-component system sensor histidine kinase SLN1
MGYSAPIVALTAFAEESNIKDCLESGMNYFLSKPIRRPQLKKVLKQYCAPIPEEVADELTPPLPVGQEQLTVSEVVRSASTRRAAAALPPVSTPSPKTAVSAPQDVTSPMVLSAQPSIASGYFATSPNNISDSTEKPFSPLRGDSMV